MRVWFLRIKHPKIDRNAIRVAKVAPILFTKIPLADLQLGMDASQISKVVNKVYKTETLQARRQHAGTLRRFLSESVEGDVVGIRANKDPKIIFGRFVRGDLKAFPGFEKDRIKGRPFELLTHSEQADLVRARLPKSVRSYSGTFCNWLSTVEHGLDSPEAEIDVPDEPEIKRRRFYSATRADQHKQVKFIRVGADLGCGQRLSRIFPSNYYHFIPIPQHNDPEFCRFTYGDVVSRKANKIQTKGRSLMNLRRGDMLVFYAGFDSEDEIDSRRLVGIFAFLVVKEAFVFVPAKSKALRFSDQSRGFDPFTSFKKAKAVLTHETWSELSLRYGDWNQHLLDPESERMDLIICGDRRQSKLLSKVQVLEAFDRRTSRYVVGKATAQKWGLTRGHDLRMSPVRTVDPRIADEVFERLRRLGKNN